jgi:hypothetical protein
MNTVFIGPYKQYDYLGQVSKTYLESINLALKPRNKTILARPVFIDFSVLDESDNYVYRDIETAPENFDKPSCIIQHAPIEYLAIQRYTKNIAIPILDNRLLKMPYNQNYQKLNSFDHVLVDSEYHKALLIKSNITSPITVFDETLLDMQICDHINKKYNLKEKTNNTFVFGFIGAYKNNIAIIQKIITSFLSSFRSVNATLIIVSRGTEQDKKHLDDYRTEILKRLSVINDNNIITIFNNLDTESVIASLNSFDCLLSLNDDYSQALYERYMLSQDKQIINKLAMNNIHIPPLHINDFSDIEDIMISVSTSDLCQKMLDTHSQKNNTNRYQKNKKNKTKNLGETLCHILQ